MLPTVGHAQARGQQRALPPGEQPARHGPDVVNLDDGISSEAAGRRAAPVTLAVAAAAAHLGLNRRRHSPKTDTAGLA